VLKLLQNDRISKSAYIRIEICAINKILLEELKQIVDEHKIVDNLPTCEKLISQIKNYAESERET
jgi:hypothetical protein